jgi:hypothetical protein
MKTEINDLNDRLETMFREQAERKSATAWGIVRVANR